MRSTRIALWMTTSLLLAAGAASAAPLAASVQDVTVIQDGAGSARILFRPGPTVSGLTGTSISNATLTLPTAGLPAQRGLRLRIYPVTTTWSTAGATWTTGWRRAGGDFDDEIFASADVDFTRGAATAVFDVTGILKEVLEAGMPADGLILTVHSLDGAGIPVADLARFGTLATATFDIRYRAAPPLRIALEP
jgi:hypothetical protein